MGLPQKKIDNSSASQNLGHAQEKHAGGQSIANEMAASKAKGRMFGDKEPQKFTKNYENLEYIYNPNEILQERQLSEEERVKQQEREDKYQANKREHEQMIAQRKADQTRWFNGSSSPVVNDNQAASRPANDNLNPQQQGQAKAEMEAYKQRALAQIAKKKSKLEKELAELEKDLTDFKNGQAIRILGIFHPGIERLIDVIINQIKKRANKMSKKAQIKFYQTTVASLEELKIALTALKLVSSFLDAAFVDNKSCLRLVLVTLATIILPIILIIISPLYILFFGLLIYMNKIPLVKGLITEQVCKCSDKVDGWIRNFKKKIDILQPEVRLQEQIAKLEQAAQQVQSGQISNRGRGAN